MSRVISLADACARYPHRFTMEHVPAWAYASMQDGRFYAPQYRSDREWYENTQFPGEIRDGLSLPKRSPHCHSTGQTWPLGKWLDRPYAAIRAA